MSETIWLTAQNSAADLQARLDAQPEGASVDFAPRREYPGPVVLARRHGGADWNAAAILDAAAFAASFHPKAVAAGGEVLMLARGVDTAVLRVFPTRKTPLAWREPTWEETRTGKKERFAVCGAPRKRSEAGEDQ